jgi:hypothetical protein
MNRLLAIASVFIFASSAQLGLTADQLADDPPLSSDTIPIEEWFRWRDRLSYAVQAEVTELLNTPSEQTIRWDPVKRTMVNAFPNGIAMSYSCQITPERKIIHIRPIKKSGYPEYDRIVLEAVDSLQGSKVLRYPKGSSRMIFTQSDKIVLNERGVYSASLQAASSLSSKKGKRNQKFSGVSGLGSFLFDSASSSTPYQSTPNMAGPFGGGYFIYPGGGGPPSMVMPTGGGGYSVFGPHGGPPTMVTPMLDGW